MASDRRLPGFTVDNSIEYRKLPDKYAFWIQRYWYWVERLETFEENEENLGSYLAALQDATQDDVTKAIRLALEERGL